jgi:enoyl-[acyl-carrier protein] reductase I
MLAIDLSGKRALVAGVADDAGFGFPIARALAEAGASVCVATWPPALNIFRTYLERGKFAESMKLASGASFEFERIYPLDAAYDELADAPEEVRSGKRYRDVGDFSVEGLGRQLVHDFGERPLDIVVHALANAPEIRKPLIDTTRAGYLAALSVSAYSMVSLVRRLGPSMREGGSFLSLSFLAGERVIPGYGGGMSSAKAALESDTRMLAYEAGHRFGVRVNAISAGPLASRAAVAIGFIDDMIEYCRNNSPLPEVIDAGEVAATAAFLSSPLAKAITGSVIYVDKGFHAMGKAIRPEDRAAVGARGSSGGQD